MYVVGVGVVVVVVKVGVAIGNEVVDGVVDVRMFMIG